MDEFWSKFEELVLPRKRYSTRKDMTPTYKLYVKPEFGSRPMKEHQQRMKYYVHAEEKSGRQVARVIGRALGQSTKGQEIKSNSPNFDDIIDDMEGELVGFRVQIVENNGRPGEIRTPDPRFRKLGKLGYLIDFAARLATVSY